MNISTVSRIKLLVKKGAIFYASHSGGKDSQAMFIQLKKLVPKDQLVVIHAHLQGIEWKDTRKQIHATTAGYQYIECHAVSSWWDTVERKKMFPAPAYRQCTSDLKRGPIQRETRRDMKAKGKLIGVNCMGLRAEESSKRAKLPAFQVNKTMSKAGREFYDMNPILDYTTKEVFQTISDAGEEPHWVYAEGNERMSCVFCIMGSTNDWKIGARLNPELYRRFVETEKRIGFTLKHKHSMEEVTGIYLNGTIVEPEVIYEDEEFACG